MAPRSGTRSTVFRRLGCSKLWPLIAGSLCLGFLTSQMVFAADFCAANSAIDQVPFFVGQTYRDILNRDPDLEGQRSWIAKLQDLNTSVCRATNPALAA